MLSRSLPVPSKAAKKIPVDAGMPNPVAKLVIVHAAFSSWNRDLTLINRVANDRHTFASLLTLGRRRCIWIYLNRRLSLIYARTNDWCARCVRLIRSYEYI